MKKFVFLAFFASTISTVSQATLLTAQISQPGFNDIFVESVDNTITVITTNGDTANANLAPIQHSFSGLDENNNPATMLWTNSAEAQASADGTLKAFAKSSVVNAFYSPLNNIPFATANGPDSNGVPEALRVDSGTAFEDTLTVFGANNLSYVRVGLGFDGFLQTDTPDHFGASKARSIVVLNGEIINAQNSTFSNTNIAVNDTFTSSRIDVVNGMIDLNLFLGTQAEFTFDDLIYSDDPLNLESESNFFSTLTIETISGFDEFGNPIDLTGAVSDTGFQFETTRVVADPTAVPEPSTLALFTLGGLFALLRRRPNLKITLNPAN